MDTATEEIIPEATEPAEPVVEATPAPTAVITEDGLIQQIHPIVEEKENSENPVVVAEADGIDEKNAENTEAKESMPVVDEVIPDVVELNESHNETADLTAETVNTSTECEMLKLHVEPEEAVPVEAEPMDVSAEESVVEPTLEPENIILHHPEEETEVIAVQEEGVAHEEIEKSQIIVQEQIVGHPEDTITHEVPIYEEHVSSDVSQQEGGAEIPMNIKGEQMEIREEIIKGPIKGEDPNVVKNVKSTTIKNGKAIIEFDDASQESGTVVVVTADGSTKELLLRSSDVQNLEEGSSVTVQQVTDENGQVYYVEAMDNVIVMEEEEEEQDHLMEEDDPRDVGEVTDIPVNIMGRTLDNPSLDPLRNGKPPPKPRLGVKVPHRHLTSQIVTKQEIANEIIERSWKCAKYPTMQNVFAQKMTKTLARKLDSAKAKQPEKKVPEKMASTPIPATNPKEKKLNNSDLIAILEGNSEPEIEPEAPVSTVKSAPVMTRELEREIALKQLSELPDDPPDEPKRDSESSQKLSSDESSIKKKRKTDDDEIPKMPRFSANVPLKTYTRKRKPSDEMVQPAEKPTTTTKANSENESTKKIDLPSNNPNNYITKSSRIIKKKIIWDPDEVSPKKLMKLEASPGKERVSVLTIKNEKEGSTIEKKLVDKEKKETIKTDTKKPDKAEVKKIPSGTTKVDILKSDKRIVVKSKDVKPRVGDTKSPNDKLAAALKFKKRLTEVDKLLMDEGAVNMLYSFKTTEDDQTKKKHSKSLVSKTNELLNDLQTNTEKVSPKALRKKDGMSPMSVVKMPKKIASPIPSAIARQKSKDSNRSSGHSPPGSPASTFSADASRIIRRHSSSSFSSNDGEEEDTVKTPRTKKAEKRGKKKVEVPESLSKKIKKDQEVDTQEEKDKEREKEKKNEEMSKTFNKLISSEPEHVPRYDKYKLLTVNKFDQLLQIVIKPNKNEEFYFNIGIMQELTSLLKELETDECNMVLLTSNAKKSFTNGINFKIVTAQKEATKKNLAKRLATSVRDFLLTLANFPKVIVAGVHGKVVGLGVTMLPLFDIIIASESATFSTPYVDLGCMAEGGSLLSLPHLAQNVLVSELLYSAQVLKSDAALRLGLITRIINDTEFKENLPSVLREMSNQSAQFMEATKKQMKQRMIPEITANLNSETEALVQQWISTECQNNFLEKYSA